MKILLVSHTATVGGAEEGLMRLLLALRTDHAVAVACPPGALARRVEEAGVRSYDLPPFEASLRLHPVHTTAGVGRLAAGAVRLARLARGLQPDLVHANSPRAGLICGPARRLGGPPVVVHVRDDLPPTRAACAVRFCLSRSTDAVIAVSEFAARRFDEGLPRPMATCVYNGIDHSRFDPGLTEPAPVREELDIPGDVALLGQVSQISPWKGQDTAIRALAALRSEGVDAHLLLVGDVTFGGAAVRYDNHAYLSSLHRLAAQLKVGPAVHFTGRRADVPALLQALDLSLLPSENEPFGRSTVESMAMGTPPLVSDTGSGPELVEDGVSGRLLPRDRPERWADAARELLSDAAALAGMGERAREASRRFNDEAHLRGVLEVYAGVLGRPAQASSDRPATVAEARAEEAVT
jgi:glycosyltransferase involved in cell wall biosynthesis